MIVTLIFQIRSVCVFLRVKRRNFDNLDVEVIMKKEKGINLPQNID